MRALAVVSAFLFMYLVFHIYDSPPSLRGPRETLSQMTKDPNLERMSLWYDCYGSLVTVL